MKKLLLIVLTILSLGGCASTDYKLYLESQQHIEVAKYNAEAEKYKAMSAIAVSGDATAKVAAVISMVMGNSNSNQGTKVQPPSSGSALQWASILVPGLTQVAGFNYNYKTLSEQSRNNASVAISTNNTFASMAASIPSSVITNTTTNTTTTTDNSQLLSGTGNLGTGSYSIIDDHALSTPVITPVVQVVPVFTTP